MSSYGSDFNASTVKATSVNASTVNAKTLSVKLGGNLNLSAVAVATVPGVTTPGVPGDVKLKTSGGDVTTLGLYYCTAGTNVATGNLWDQVSQMNAGTA
jgi:hypothetical protein